MSFAFSKYHGTGNDFVLLHDFEAEFPLEDADLVRRMCDRHFGIGADGLMVLRPPKKTGTAFHLIYFNANGGVGSLCGNGARCAVSFAKKIGLFKGHALAFDAADGTHEAWIDQEEIRVHMAPTSIPRQEHGGFFIDTGSPHHVRFVDGLATHPVEEEGKSLRYTTYGIAGANINFVERSKEGAWHVRTYERGVEGETLSCGTGVTAVALVLAHLKKVEGHVLVLHTPGGKLKVQWEQEPYGFDRIELMGPAEFVFSGQWK